MRTNQKNSRPGVTLLFTISMIVLFLLMGTTFVVVANDYFKTAKRRSSLNSYKVDATALLDRAFSDVLRGPALTDQSSPLRGMSILEDQYGYGLTATATSASVGPGTSFITITANTFTEVRDGSTIDITTDMGYFDGFYNGRVLTITDGDVGVGYSARIVSHRAVGGNINFVIPRDKDGIGWAGFDGEILINGRDFAGTGAGAGNFTLASIPDPDTATPAGALAGGNAALLVNKRGQDRATLTDGTTGYLSIDHSVNEPYDVADFQNMYLSGRDANGNIIPSFHRDTMHSYLFNNVSSANDQIRGYCFRPLYFGNANLNNSTANADFPSNLTNTGNITGTANDESNYDVDNTLDGVNDSVWIDIGLPVQTDSQGRQFRPLVAYHIVDLDGNLNLNAHGSFADQQLGVGTRRGGGYGVAEISLRGVLGGVGGDYLALLNDRSDDDDDRSTNDASGPGSTNTNVMQTTRKLFGYPTGLNVGSGFFATGGDLFGRYSLERQTGLTNGFGDDALPEFTPGVLLTAVSSRSPYNADFSINGGLGDRHFGATDLEVLLRDNDVDSSLLYSRLDESNYSTLHAGDNQFRVTTHSFEVAMPAYPVTAAQLLRAELVSGLGLSTAAQVRTEFADYAEDQAYLSREILLGGKFNLNRPFGDGVDGEAGSGAIGDGVFDEPRESYPDPTGQDQVHPETIVSETFDLDNNGDGRTGDQFARQQMAKQLYILALLVCGDTKPSYMVNGTGTPADYRRMVAQWAVNVVDFQDNDSIITVFEYDTEPFNAMDVDGDPTTAEPERDFVYGVERPELLLTESSAQHIRLNEDLDSEVDFDQADGDAAGELRADGDADWDSQRRPQSSAFIELMNPWTQTTAFQRNPRELGDGTGVNIAAAAPAGAGGVTPVWRIAAKRDDSGLDNEDIVRTIYFRDPSTNAAAIPTSSADNFYPSRILDSAANRRFIAPQSRLVIGGSGNYNELSTGAVAGDRNLTTFGRLTSGPPLTDADMNSIRSVELLYDATPVTPAGTTDQIQVRNAAGAAGVESRDCHAVVIDMPRSLSLSDPDGDYFDMSSGTLTFSNTELDGQTFTPVSDIPWDNQAHPDDFNAIWTNGVTENFRVLHLQRLADPTLPWDEFANPYVSIDKISLDLLAFNGLISGGAGASENVLTGPGVTETVTTGTTEFRTIERGESQANATDARRRFFKSETGSAPTAATAAGGSHFFDFNFEETLGEQNAAMVGTTPIGWFVFNNRPFANVGELMNVPYGSTLETLARFNVSKNDVAAFDSGDPDAFDDFGAYMGDDQFGHLLAYGGCDPTLAGGGGSTATELTPNRFDRILEFVEVPNLFLGSETFIAPVTKAASTNLNVGFNAPFNSIPNFRHPGKMNLNTMGVIENSTTNIVDPDDPRWTALKGGFGDALNFAPDPMNPVVPDLVSERDYHQITINSGGTPMTQDLPTDFGGFFTTSVGAELVPPGLNMERKGESLMFRRTVDDTDGISESIFDNTSAIASRRFDSSTVFKNELRQRLSATTTTRSSVFAIWITIGYFEVDNAGRVGAELGADEGIARRNRAFYMVDRSIPVACEPGTNHNVDQAVLVRTIIE